VKTVMIVAGESSGEWYGSMLTKELKRMWPEIRVVGIGGERMRDAGVEILSGISSGLGITELLPSLRRIRESFRAAAKALSDLKPDVVVLIDYPDFNFRLGRVAKKKGLRVLYYVSPQVWAWRKRRVKTMGEITDRVAAILPFEEEIYRKAGIPCEFVGHPALEEIEDYEAETAAEASPVPGPDSALKIALLPGSRPNELKALLPLFAGLVKVSGRDLPGARFFTPLAPNIEAESFREDIEALKKEGVTFSRGDALRCLAFSDAAVIASGTATLQAALLGVPSVVVYKVSALTYYLARAVLKVRHISLVNIIAGKEVVREMIQHGAHPEAVLEELTRIVVDKPYREKMVASMEEVRKSFSGRRPSRRVAGMIAELTGWALPEIAASTEH